MDRTLTQRLLAATTWVLACSALLVAAPLDATAENPDGDPAWSRLFDGRSLDGWTTMAGGSADAWAAREGELVVARPGSGGWLRTEKMFRDFELELDFLLPPGGNSGVGLRCPSAGDPAFAGFELQILDSHGDEPRLDGCGAVYHAVAPAVQAARPAGEWNTYRVRLVGDVLDVWLNGEPIHAGERLDGRGFFRRPDQPRPLDARAPTGYIALQDHGAAVRFRNIRLRDLSPDPDPGDFEHAFDGRTTAGWTHRGGGSFTFQRGTLVAADGPGHLFSDRSHRDIELRALVRVAEPAETGASRTGNSGIYFRTMPRPDNPDTWPLGYEAQIDNADTRPRHYTGCVYDLAPAATGRPITRDGAWFDYRIVAIGDRVRTWINGTPMVDARLDAFDEGRVAIQTHHPGNRVQFRDVRWRTPAESEP